MEPLCPRGPYPAHSVPTLRKEREGWGPELCDLAAEGSYYLSPTIHGWVLITDLCTN